MSLHPQEVPPVPEETIRVARAAFPRGNVFMRMRDELGTISHDHLYLSCRALSFPRPTACSTIRAPDRYSIALF
jgi:hypothetical protein